MAGLTQQTPVSDTELMTEKLGSRTTAAQTKQARQPASIIGIECIYVQESKAGGMFHAYLMINIRVV